ncbi:MAG: endonuclease [Gammaproteobacteria bacterium]
MELQQLFRTLMDHHGPQEWWPARTRFEMVAGAILVQNTRWSQAARAVDVLEQRGWLEPGTLAAAPLSELAAAVRPAGFYRRKAPALKAFARWLVDAGGFENLSALDTAPLRRLLLDREGIGPETADCILVYAFGRPVFIADSYARRLLNRTGVLGDRTGRAGYEAVRSFCESRLPGSASLMNEFHALIVAHSKHPCGREPRCAGCVLAAGCATGRRLTGRRNSCR